jgi:N utilization substance protein B
MANRHLSRSIVLQTLFEWDFIGMQDERVQDILRRNVEEFAPENNDMPFMHELTDTIIKKRTIVDQIIEKAAPDWPIDKISIVDRNILRQGLAELLFGDREQVPPKVAINEAIELAKTFGGENSSKFINGVLGAVYKELGEPGKDQVSKHAKAPAEPIDISKLPIEKKVGGVIYSVNEGMLYLAFVHDVFGHWTLPKGSIEESEQDESGMIRKIKEKIGIDVSIVEKIDTNEYVASHPEKGKIRKQVMYFLAEAQYEPLTLESSGGLNDAKWFPVNEVADLTMYDDILPIVMKAIERITNK